MSDNRETMRCSICAINWPHHKRFNTCPQCDERCSPLRLLNDWDPILSWEEAMEYIAQHGLEEAHVAKPVITVEHLVEDLHRDLDRWAHELPRWPKR